MPVQGGRHIDRHCVAQGRPARIERDRGSAAAIGETLIRGVFRPIVRGRRHRGPGGSLHQHVRGRVVAGAAVAHRRRAVNGGSSSGPPPCCLPLVAQGLLLGQAACRTPGHLPGQLRRPACGPASGGIDGRRRGRGRRRLRGDRRARRPRGDAEPQPARSTITTPAAAAANFITARQLIVTRQAQDSAQAGHRHRSHQPQPMTMRPTSAQLCLPCRPEDAASPIMQREVRDTRPIRTCYACLSPGRSRSDLPSGDPPAVPKRPTVTTTPTEPHQPVHEAVEHHTRILPPAAPTSGQAGRPAVLCRAAKTPPCQVYPQVARDSIP